MPALEIRLDEKFLVLTRNVRWAGDGHVLPSPCPHAAIVFYVDSEGLFAKSSNALVLGN